jgi:hypothetical protein
MDLSPQDNISIADNKNVYRREIDYYSSINPTITTTLESLSDDSENDSSIYSSLEDEDISIFEEEFYEEEFLEEDSDSFLCVEETEDFYEDSSYSSVQSMEFISIRYVRGQSRINFSLISAQATKESLSISDNDSTKISFMDDVSISSSAIPILDFSYRSSNSKRLPGGLFYQSSETSTATGQRRPTQFNSSLQFMELEDNDLHNTTCVEKIYWNYPIFRNEVQILKTEGAFATGLTSWQSQIESFHHQNTAELDGYSLFSSESIYFNITRFNLQEQHNNYKRRMNCSISITYIILCYLHSYLLLFFLS